MEEAGASMVEDSLLPLALPEDATSLRVHRPSQRARLQASGICVDGPGADVEVGDLGELTGEADWVVVDLEVASARRDRHRRWVRMAYRAIRHLDLRVRVRRTRRGLANVGYKEIIAYQWDKGHSVAVPLRAGETTVSGISERLPNRAAVVGWRGESRPALLERVLIDAARALSLPLLAPERILARNGMMVVLTPRHVLRVAVGPARGRIERQHRMLATLAAHLEHGTARRFLPLPSITGVSGLATWALEPRLDGVPAAASLSGALEPESIDFLSLLHPVGMAAGDGADRFLQAARVVESHGNPDQERRLKALVGRTVEAMADVPRGFGHGDFFHGNLLVNDDGLTGVIDWDTAGSDRLPLLDLLHLRLTAVSRGGSSQWGPSIVRHLVPWASGGGDRAAATYLDRLGVRADKRQLLGFVVAYWLDRLAYQLSTYADRTTRPVWFHNNYEVLLDALTARDGPDA